MIGRQDFSDHGHALGQIATAWLAQMTVCEGWKEEGREGQVSCSSGVYASCCHATVSQVVP